MELSKKTQAFHVSEAGDLSGFYIRGGASKLWDDKSTWAVRAQHEGNFYGELLRGNGVGSVLDVAAASGFHAISLKQAGFSVSALDALEEFVVLGKENQKTFEVSFPFMVAKWSELNPTMFAGELFDTVICLGGSLHHTDQQGVVQLFKNSRALMKPPALFVVEQRNYEKLFQERIPRIDHPSGWSYDLEYCEPRSLQFHLVDPLRGIDAVTLVTVTFEDELLAIAENNGFRLKEIYFDHGKTATRADASLIQFVFQVVEPV